MIWWWIFAGCFGGRHIRKVSNLSKHWTPEKVVDLLESPHSYVRLNTLEEIRRHQWEPNDEAKVIITPVLMTLLATDTEPCVIRGQTGYLLGRWQISDAALSIQTAINECDGESRYWMLRGLEHLTDSPYAKGIIQDLKTDSDLFIRTEAIRWSQP
jgi:hypothetical protein